MSSQNITVFSLQITSCTIRPQREFRRGTTNYDFKETPLEILRDTKRVVNNSQNNIQIFLITYILSRHHLHKHPTSAYLFTISRSPYAKPEGRVTNFLLQLWLRIKPFGSHVIAMSLIPCIIIVLESADPADH